MINHASLLAGLMVGLSVAAPVGPMALLCIQRTIQSGLTVGLSTGLGGATANVIYGTVALFGLNSLVAWVQSNGHLLSAVAGLFLLWSGTRTMSRRTAVARTVNPPVQSPLRAYASATLYNLANPTSLLLIAALLSSTVAVAQPPGSDAGADMRIEPGLFLTGMFAAASAWWLTVTGSVALVRSRLSAGVVVSINRGAGLLLLIYALLTLARSAGLR